MKNNPKLVNFTTQDFMSEKELELASLRWDQVKDSYYKRLKELGFNIIATSGTHDFLSKRGIPSIEVKKILEGRPNILDYLISNKVQMIINTIENQLTYKDSMILRRNAINQKIPYFTTLRAAKAAINSIDQLINYKLSVKPIQKIIKFKSK